MLKIKMIQFLDFFHSNLTMISKVHNDIKLNIMKHGDHVPVGI